MRGPLPDRCRPSRHPGALAVYYVRLPSGDEKTYRTVEEMVWDVELGVITKDALIFHPATKEWVLVTRHPQLGTRFVSEEGAAEEVGLDFDLLSDAEIKGMAPRAPNSLSLPSQTSSSIPTSPSMPRRRWPPPPEVKPAEGLAIAGEFLTLKEPIPSLRSTRATRRPPRHTRRHRPHRAPRSRHPPPTWTSRRRSTANWRRCRRTGLDSTEYKPLEWKPEPRFRGLALIGGAVALVLLVSTGAWFGWQWWSNRPVGCAAAGRARFPDTGRHRTRRAGRRFRVRQGPGARDRPARRGRDGRHGAPRHAVGPGGSFPAPSLGHRSRGFAP